MTTYPTSFLAEISDISTKIPEGKLAYFRERQRSRLYEFIIKRFLEKEKSHGLSKATLAKRINKRPEQITRWLSTPGNWTLDTISDLMLAICGCEIDFLENDLSVVRPRNITQLENLKFPGSTVYVQPIASS